MIKLCKAHFSIVGLSPNRNDPNSGTNGCDLFINYQKETGMWTEPVDMEPDINKPGIIERFPQVALNKKYLFFIPGFGEFYWVDAEIINDLRTKMPTLRAAPLDG